MNWADSKHSVNSVKPLVGNTEPSRGSMPEGVETRHGALVQQTCNRCGTTKTETEFHIHRHGKRRKFCKECFRDSERQRIYGITKEQFWNIYHKQDGQCAICEKRMRSDRWKGFAIDHCHTTNEVRGLLCTQCNVGLGNFKDDPIRLLKAVEYLKV
jgi:hypothetical protein